MTSFNSREEIDLAENLLTCTIGQKWLDLQDLVVKQML